MPMNRVKYAALFVFLVGTAGCRPVDSPVAVNAGASSESEVADKSIVLVSVQSDAQEDPQSVDMAMKLASFSLDEGRQVALFFNVKGVTCPTTDFPESFAFQENDPLRSQLIALINRGAEIHVCPICMKALGVEAADILSGAEVTTRAKLFANIGPDTSVFTY
ncbi:MAG: DsrE family protein [Pirellulaceae bacterium]|nr:DsrE family protein [Pirellulaceae bacterium]